MEDLPKQNAPTRRLTPLERLRLPHPPFPSCFSQPRFSLAPPPSRCTAGAARIVECPTPSSGWCPTRHRLASSRPTPQQPARGASRRLRRKVRPRSQFSSGARGICTDVCVAGFDIAWFLWKEVLQSPVDSSPRDGFFAKPWKHFDLPASL